MKILFMFALLTVTLSACATSPPPPPPEPAMNYYWMGQTPQPSAQEFSKTKYACIQESRPFQGPGYNRSVAELRVELQLASGTLEHCMAAHGWEWRVQQSGNSGNTPIQSSLTAREQAAYEEARAKALKEVQAFAADPAHPYFDEVAPEILRLIKNGSTLEEAYDKASLHCTTQKVDMQTVKNCR